MSLSEADVLEGAVMYLEEHGWTQGTIQSGGGAVCAIGSIRGTLGLLHDHENVVLCRMCDLWRDDHDEYMRLLLLAGETQAVVENFLHGRLDHWNDATQRHDAEVKKLFLEVAQKVRLCSED